VSSKIKLNKNTLREQKQSLQLYQEFLPTLELRKQQLQAEVRTVQQVVERKHEALLAMMADARPYAGMLAATLEAVRPLVVVQEVEVSIGNVAGVKIPVFQKVHFKTVPYSLLGTPPFFDTAVNLWRQAVSVREEVKVLRRKEAALAEQLIKTTQRINLYEKVLIPECKENIRRIRVYLGDQQTAAVVRAKIAKAKLTRAAQMDTGSGG